MLNNFSFENFSAMHAGGVQLGKTIVLYGAGFTIGKNIVRVFHGKIRGSVAVANVIRDVAIFFGISYLAGFLSSGAIQVASQATNASVPVAITPTTPGASGSVIADSASDLSTAASNLVERVTSGLFGTISSAGTNIGDKLTASTADTAFGGPVATIVSVFGSIGTILGESTVSGAPAVLFGLIIGAVFAFIFDK